jgi:hypothetical protein
MIDVTGQINAVRRQAGARVLEAGEARTVTLRQTYDAGIEEVWDACTNPEHLVPLGDERWAEFGPGAVGVGWDLGLMGLASHLASGDAVDPRESAAWAASEEGRLFMSLSSHRWCEANVAAGADAASAQAAADRTTAGYTGTSLSEPPAS